MAAFPQAPSLVGLTLRKSRFGVSALQRGRLRLTSPFSHPCRCHIISQFNRGFYSYIIATDEQDLAGPEEPQEGRKKRKKGGKATGRCVGPSTGA